MAQLHPVGVSPFPQPPEFAKQYTDANITKKNVLAPPSVPIEFVVFGEEYNLESEMIRSLQSQKMQQLFSSTGDWRSELKKLNRSTVAAFLDLLDILIRCPNHPERLEKINNLRLLFINMHHLINEYRPLQARDSLQTMMRNQIKGVESVTERFRNYLALSREAVDNVLQNLPISTSTSAVVDEEEMNVDSEEVLNSIMEKIQESYAILRRSVDAHQKIVKKNLALCHWVDHEEICIEDINPKSNSS